MAVFKFRFVQYRTYCYIHYDTMIHYDSYGTHLRQKDNKRVKSNRFIEYFNDYRR